MDFGGALNPGFASLSAWHLYVSLYVAPPKIHHAHTNGDKPLENLTVLFTDTNTRRDNTIHTYDDFAYTNTQAHVVANM